MDITVSLQKRIAEARKNLSSAESIHANTKYVYLSRKRTLEESTADLTEAEAVLKQRKAELDQLLRENATEIKAMEKEYEELKAAVVKEIMIKAIGLEMNIRVYALAGLFGVDTDNRSAVTLKKICRAVKNLTLEELRVALVAVTNTPVGPR